MAEQRRKGKQLNFRLSDQLAEQFEEYCGNRGISMTQFLENSIRQALGQPLSIPPDALGLPQRIANVETAGTAISASEVQGLAELVREIVRSELAESSGELVA